MIKNINFLLFTFPFSLKSITFAAANDWRGARVVEEARLESVYASKAHPGFESPSLRLSSGSAREYAAGHFGSKTDYLGQKSCKKVANSLPLIL